MKITAIKAQVKNPDRVSVYIDQEYSFSLNYNQLLEQKLHVGLEFDPDRQKELQHISEVGKLYDRLLRYVLIRPRSRKEVTDYCRRKKIGPEDYEPLMAKLEKRGYINDEHFAHAWVENRRLNKAVSRRRLNQELAQKGIAPALIEKILSQQSAHDETQALQTIITKKRRLARYQDDQKLTQYLVRQGFSYDDVRQALSAD